MRRISLMVSLVAACTALGLAGLAAKVPGLFAISAAIVIAFGLLIVLTRVTTREFDPADRRRLAVYTVLSFALHVLFGLILRIGGTAEALAPDAAHYHEGARQLVDHWEQGFPYANIAFGKEGFYYLVAYVYSVLGPYPETAIVMNAAFGAALIPVMADLTRRMFGSPAARAIPVLLLAIPSFIIWPSLLLREASILFLMVVAAWAAVRLTGGFAVSALLLLTTSLAVLLTFRASVALAIAPALAVGTMFSRRELANSMPTGFVVLALFAALVLGAGLGYRGYQGSVDKNLQGVSEVRSAAAREAATGVAPDADVGTTRQALRYLPIGVSAFTLGPFPWQLTSGRQLVLVPDMLVWWVLLPITWRGVRAAWDAIGRAIFVLLLPAAGVTAVLALLLGNFGTIIRERPQLIVLLLPFTALGLDRRRAQARAATGAVAGAR